MGAVVSWADYWNASHTPRFAEPARDAYTTPQGCRVIASWYTSQEGVLTEVVILESATEEDPHECR
jgi:hypothetical protein